MLKYFIVLFIHFQCIFCFFDLRGRTFGDLISYSVSGVSNFFNKLSGTNTTVPLPAPPEGSIFNAQLIPGTADNTGIFGSDNPLISPILSSSITNKLFSPLTSLASFPSSPTPAPALSPEDEYPSLFQQLQRSGFEGIFTLFKLSPSIISSIKQATSDSPLTLLLPSNQAVLNLELLIKTKLIENDKLREEVLSYMIIPRAVPSSALNPNLSLSINALSGTPLNFRLSPYHQITINRKFLVIEKNMISSNGLIHVLDLFLLPPRWTAETPLHPISPIERPFRNLALHQVIPLFSSLSVTNRLIQNFLPRMDDTSQKWTVFVPCDSAYDSLAKESWALLQERLTLAEIVRSWIYPGYLDWATMPISQFLLAPSMNGENDLLLVKTPNLELSINNIALSVRDPIHTRNGIVFIIDSIIIPSSFIQTIQKDNK